MILNEQDIPKFLNVKNNVASQISA